MYDDNQNQGQNIEHTLRLEQKNRELQDFAFTASHHLNEPLRKIQAFGSQLKSTKGEPLGDDGLNFLLRMINAAKRMQDMLNGLPNYSRVTTTAQPDEEVNQNLIHLTF